jgi:hypothetical protein
VIRRRRPHRLEEGAPLLDRPQERGHVLDRAAGQPFERQHLGAPARRGDAKDGVGAKTREYDARPSRRPNRAVMIERVGRRIGGREHFDAESVKERARPELR